MRIIRKCQEEEIQRNSARNQKLLQAHRWLAEFDDFLAPLWSFLLNEQHRQIDDVREDLRKFWREKVNK